MDKKDFYIPRTLYQIVNLSMRAKILYSILVDRVLKECDDKYQPFAVRQSELAEELGVSVPTIKKIVQELVDYGLVEKCGRSSQKVNMYKLKKVDWLRE